MKMKKTVLQAAMAAAIGVTALSAQAAAVNTGDILTIDAGVASYDAYYGTLTGISSGSYFAMDMNNDSAITGTEKIATSQGTEGIVIGETTVPGAYHSGFPLPGDTNAIDAPWAFLGNTGSHWLSSPVTGDTTNGLDFSGWTFAWNSILEIPLGTGAWQPLNCGTLGCTGTFTNGNAHFSWDGVYGNAYSLFYTATVPDGDPSGFGGVQYYLHLEGTVTEGSTPDVPVPAAVWLFASGLFGLITVARKKCK